MSDMDEACDHVQEFLTALRGLYAKHRNFVTLDDPINAHCHVCSSIHKIPEDLMRRPSDYGKNTEALRHVADRNRCPKDGECPPDHYERKGDVEKPVSMLTIRRHTTSSINVRTEDGRESIPLHSPISVYEVAAEDGNGVWEETYATKDEKDAFVRGYRAGCALHGDMNPKIIEDR